MSENWERGDLALCVVSCNWTDADTDLPATGPRLVQCYDVLDVGIHESGLVGLEFAPWRGDYYDCLSFIKVTPPKDMVLDEEEILLPA